MEKIQELVKTYETTQAMLTKTDDLLIELSQEYSKGRVTAEELAENIPEEYHLLIDVIVYSDWGAIDDEMGYSKKDNIIQL